MVISLRRVSAALVIAFVSASIVVSAAAGAGAATAAACPLPEFTREIPKAKRVFAGGSIEVEGCALKVSLRVDQKLTEREAVGVHLDLLDDEGREGDGSDLLILVDGRLEADVYRYDWWDRSFSIARAQLGKLKVSDSTLYVYSATVDARRIALGGRTVAYAYGYAALSSGDFYGEWAKLPRANDDVEPPRVTVRPQTVDGDVRAKLAFSLQDGSNHASVSTTIDGRLVSVMDMTWLGEPRMTVDWLPTPASGSARTVEFCVIAVDPSGNRSKRCAPVRIRGTEPSPLPALTDLLLDRAAIGGGRLRELRVRSAEDDRTRIVGSGYQGGALGLWSLNAETSLSTSIDRFEDVVGARRELASWVSSYRKRSSKVSALPALDGGVVVDLSGDGRKSFVVVWRHATSVLVLAINGAKKDDLRYIATRLALKQDKRLTDADGITVQPDPDPDPVPSPPA